MKLTINHLYKNGAVNAMTEYGDGDWCILSFPSLEAASKWAHDNGGTVELSEEVRAQQEALNGPQGG